MDRDLFKYFGIYAVSYLALILCEYFLFGWLIEMVAPAWKARMVLWALLLLIVDPLVVRYAGDVLFPPEKNEEGDNI